MIMLHDLDASMIVAGCDEVGRGALAGPIVAAAVILPAGYEYGLFKDSKQLTHQQRLWINTFIKEVALDWSIASVSVQEIDRTHVAKATYKAMHRAIDKLYIRPDLLLIDGKYFLPYPGIQHRCIVQGDQWANAIAAASVLAKVYRDQYMEALSLHETGYAWEVNKGYPTSSHLQAIQELGMTTHHRKSLKQIAKNMQPNFWNRVN